MTRIFVGALAWETTDEGLAAPFATWGSLESCTIRRDADSGRSQGFGFVEMTNALEAAVAIQQLDGTELDGRPLHVAEARPVDNEPQIEELARRLGAAASVVLPHRELAEAAAAVRIETRLFEQLVDDPFGLWQVTPRQFEELICEVLDRLGFSAVHLTPESKDKGVDIYAIRDGSNGSSLFVVECKRWVPPHHVGIDVVQRLYGVMHWTGAAGGLVATTSRFTRPARDWRTDVDEELALLDMDGIHAWMRACVD